MMSCATIWHQGLRTGLFLLAVCLLLSLPACQGSSPTSSDDDPVDLPEIVLVSAGSFVMGDGAAYCGVSERNVSLTRDFYLGQHEVTNQDYLEAVQWAYGHDYITATTSSVLDNLDGSTMELLDLDDGDCEIAFSGGVFSLSDAGHGDNNGNHPVKEAPRYGAARY